MIRTLLLTALAAAAIAGCTTDATPPTPAELTAQCEATCVAADGAFERLDGDACVCLQQGPAEKVDPGQSSFDSRCTEEGCIAKCGVGLCVNARSNDQGGCNYYCLARPRPPEVM